MKFVLFAGRILACYSIYANANPLPPPPASPTSTPAAHYDTLEPITVEVAPNGIIAPGHAGQESKNVSPRVDNHSGDLEIFPVIQPPEEAPTGDAESEESEDSEYDHLADYTTATSSPSRYNPFRHLGHRLGHGPVVQRPRPVTATSTLTDPASAAVTQPIHKDHSARYLIIPLVHDDRNESSPLSSPSGFAEPSKDTPSPDSKDGLVYDRSPTDMSTQGNASNGSPITKFLPNIPKCLTILQPLRELAERLVYIKEAPQHTLISACHFQSLNQTHYGGQQVERMREICWDLFETIQLEGRRRYERCISKMEDKYQYNSNALAEEGPHGKLESGVDKFSYRAYHLTPGSVKDFVKEHPDLSPEDIEWLNHDMNTTADLFSTPPQMGSVSRRKKRSWFTDFLKAIFAAEVDATVHAAGKDIEELVEEEVEDHRKKATAHNHTSHVHDYSPDNTTKVPRSKKNGQSNRVYVHKEWYPIAPINKYVNQPRSTGELPLTAEDMASYLEFIRDTSNLNDRQFKHLKDAVKHELHLATPILSSNKHRGGKDKLKSGNHNEKYDAQGPPPVTAEASHKSGGTKALSESPNKATSEALVAPPEKRGLLEDTVRSILLPPIVNVLWDVTTNIQKCKAAAMLATSDEDVPYLLNELDARPSDCVTLKDYFKGTHLLSIDPVYIRSNINS
jgi:hypothetical protein